MKGLEKMNCDTYIKNIEALPNFGGWVIYLDNGLPFAYAYKEGNDSIYKVYFTPVDGWQNMDDASSWVDDWEADIHHVDQVTSNVSDSIDLLQQLY